MRTPSALALLAVCLTAATTHAQQPKSPPKKPEPAVKIGDPAPPLTVDKWLQGPEVKGFEQGKVYVVVFWNAWLGETFQSLRQANKLHAKFKDVIPVAISSEKLDPKKTPEISATRYISEGDRKFTFSFGNDEKGVTRKAYVNENPSHPASDSQVFIVGPDGKIAFAAEGPQSPANLTAVVSKVLDGTWKGQKDADAIAAAEAAYQKATDDFNRKVGEIEVVGKQKGVDRAKRAEEMSKAATDALASFEEFVKAHPAYEERTDTPLYRAHMTMMTGRMELTAKATDALVAVAHAQADLKPLVHFGQLVAVFGMQGITSPAIETPKLMDALIDGITSAKFEDRDGLGEVMNYMPRAAVIGGRTEKGKALMRMLVEKMPASVTAEERKKYLESFDREAKELEAQVKAMQAELKK